MDIDSFLQKEKKSHFHKIIFSVLNGTFIESDQQMIQISDVLRQN